MRRYGLAFVWLIFASVLASIAQDASAHEQGSMRFAQDDTRQPGSEAQPPANTQEAQPPADNNSRPHSGSQDEPAGVEADVRPKDGKSEIGKFAIEPRGGLGGL